MNAVRTRLMRRLPSKLCVIAAVMVLAAGCVAPPPPTKPQVPVPANAGVYKVGEPYQIDGTWYYPHEQPDYDETGIASWYGQAFHGKSTANGEMFDVDGLTAAHRTLPMPVNVQVTNLENGKSMVLRVNDRGPFAKGRIIDVSERAAKLLGFYEQGTARVRVVYLNRADRPDGRPQPFGADTPADVAAAASASPMKKVETGTLAALPGTKVSQAAPAPPRTIQPAEDAAAPAERPTGHVSQVPVPAATRMYVQVGAFTNYQNARRLMARLGGGLRIFPVQKSGLTLYRVRLGPFDGLNDADAALKAMLGVGASDAQIVVDQ
jgi:rare lipoprotein A